MTPEQVREMQKEVGKLELEIGNAVLKLIAEFHQRTGIVPSCPYLRYQAVVGRELPLAVVAETKIEIGSFPTGRV